MDAATVRKRSLSIAGHRTSVSLEAEFWRALKQIAAAEGRSVASLAAEVDRGRGAANLSSALRVFVLRRVQAGAERSPASDRSSTPAGSDRR
ncbi:MAG TPA: ribbon-helix-helix domain-containing protein [Methylocystis sp.]|nr:ribbon-helix-helix domain-containing protein [Methylocystis sp.]